VGSVEATSAGQNAAQAVQDGFDRGLVGHGAARVQQSSISIFNARHDAGDTADQYTFSGWGSVPHPVTAVIQTTKFRRAAMPSSSSPVVENGSYEDIP